MYNTSMFFYYKFVKAPILLVDYTEANKYF